MTSLEDRTRSALHQEADALVVTDDELTRMEEHLMTLVDTPTPDRTSHTSARRRWAVAGVAAAAALVVVGGVLWRNGQESSAPVPASTPTATQPALFDPAIVGLWRLAPAEPWLWNLTADGRIAWSSTAQGYIRPGTSTTRVVARAGDVYDLIAPDGCRTRMQFSLTGTDAVEGRILEDSCTPGSEPSDEAFELARVSGRDTASAPLQPAHPAGAAQQVDDINTIAGTWVEPGSGTLLAIGSSLGDGTVEYLVDDGGDGPASPDQTGTVTMARSGATVPTPTAKPTVGCAPVFTEVTSTRATMTTVSGAGGCFPEGSTQTWIALN